jgi:hypothetical protein
MSAPEPLSAERLAEIRNRRLDEVTPGPWLVSEDQDGHPLIYVERTTPQRNVYARVLLAADGASEADVQFVASARRSVPELIGEVERLNEQAERRRVRLAAAETDLLNVRGALSPNGFPRKVPMELGETVTPAVEWLIGEVERLSGELAKYVDKEPTVAEEMQYLSGCLTAVHDLCDYPASSGPTSFRRAACWPLAWSNRACALLPSRWAGGTRTRTIGRRLRISYVRNSTTGSPGCSSRWQRRACSNQPACS